MSGNSSDAEDPWEAHRLVAVPAPELPRVLGRGELAWLIGDQGTGAERGPAPPRSLLFKHQLH